MTGLQRICKMYGGMTINGVKYVWDYARDEAVLESEMKKDKERSKASDIARAKLIADVLRQEQAESKP